MQKIAFLLPVLFLLMCGIQNNASAQQNILTIGNQSYILSQNDYIDSMSFGQVKTFTFQVIPTTPDTLARYGFYLEGYGEGFPVYSIISDQSSGGAMGTQTIIIQFTHCLLVGEYEGYLPVHVYYDETNVAQYLPLHINMKVKP